MFTKKYLFFFTIDKVSYKIRHPSCKSYLLPFCFGKIASPFITFICCFFGYDYKIQNGQTYFNFYTLFFCFLLCLLYFFLYPLFKKFSTSAFVTNRGILSSNKDKTSMSASFSAVIFTFFFLRPCYRRVYFSSLAGILIIIIFP